MPRDHEAVEVLRQITASGFPSDRIWYTPGNHDGQSAWMVPYLDALGQRGVKAAAPGTTHDAYYARVRLTCPVPLTDVSVDWLMLGDRNRSQDYEVCGSLVDPSTELRKSGQPAGAYDLHQLDFLRARISQSAEVGTKLVVVAHHVPPETTFGSWPGEGREPVACVGHPLHGVIPAISTPGRPSFDWPSLVDGLTPRERCDAWSGTAPFLGEDPQARPDWMRQLVGQVHDETGADALRLWVGSHSHLPTPIHVQNGHGMDAVLYPDGEASPVQVVQAGALTRWHSGYGASQFVVVEWDCAGEYRIERWSTADWAHTSCGAHSIRPTSYPGPYQLAPLVGSW